MNKKNVEIFTVVDDRVEVTVKVDYDKGKISLVERDGINPGYRDKRWTFAGREIEFMNGWRHILNVIEMAITEAEKRLQEFQEEREERTMELIRMASMTEDELKAYQKSQKTNKKKK